jgi:Vacuole effluxer Atg22 like
MTDAEDAKEEAVLPAKDDSDDSHGIQVTDDHPVAPDQFDSKWETSKYEIWAYYAYYAGNNGLSLFNFGPSAFQNLLSQAAGDSGTVAFIGRLRDINSVILLSNGISFAIQVVLLLSIGAYAGKNIMAVTAAQDH